jgi:hypothetical protein
MPPLKEVHNSSTVYARELELQYRCFLQHAAFLLLVTTTAATSKAQRQAYMPMTRASLTRVCGAMLRTLLSKCHTMRTVEFVLSL